MDPQTSPQDFPTDIFIDEPFVDHDDILRGDRRSILQTAELGSTHSAPHSAEQRSAVSSTSPSTASSSSVRLAGGRIGTLATRLERAITRWARKNWADSSSSMTSSTSSETSHSSFRTRSKSKWSRRKRPPPSLVDTIQREQSERAVAARIRAREIGRMIPREFNLYSPPLSSLSDGDDIEGEQRSVRAFSLDKILPQLEHIRRKPGKHRRPGHHSHAPRTELDQPRHPHRHHTHRGHLTKLEARNAPRTDTLEVPSIKVEKGKGKDKISYTRPAPDPLQTASTSRRDPVEEKPAQAWWLDVASPSWEDMRTLGKLLHLHPLTLEDILHQEPREKLESFSKLGYYFIVFRAIESSTQQERSDAVSQKTGSSQFPVQNVANETCIYLAVFRDGICTFHFTNISEHLDRVRGKLKAAAQATRRSSAWIAHGILDSVVDSFFPLVEEIGEQVAAIESAVYNEDSPASTIAPIPLVNSRELQALPVAEKVAPLTSPVDEKHISSRDMASVKTAKTQFSLPRLTCGLMLWRLRRILSRLIAFLCMRNKLQPRDIEPSFTLTALGLHRMARTRRLATSVARVLATKPEVVAGIRKRLLTSDGLATSDDAEVAIYFGDVQDHILTLQQSLVHYERMLSESHPTYLQNLRIDFLRARAKGDFAAYVLAVVAVGVVPPSVVIGVLSMNVTVPHNNLDDGKLWVFGLSLVINLCIQIAYLALVRYWWVKAKRRPRVVLE